VALDLMMPVMDGYETCRRVRAEAVTADVPVIMLTALAHAADMPEGFLHGADDHVVKPFSPRELLGRVRSARVRTAVR